MVVTAVSPRQVNLRHTVLFVSGLMALGTILRCGRKFTKLLFSESVNQTVFLIRYPMHPGRSPYSSFLQLPRLRDPKRDQRGDRHGSSASHLLHLVPNLGENDRDRHQPGISEKKPFVNLFLQASNALGIGISMIFAPALIHYKPTNGTNHTQHFQHLHIEAGATEGSWTQTGEQIKANIDLYLEILAGVSILLFGLFCAYFPSKPAHPPAPSSAIARTKFLKGIQEMLSNTDVLLACFAYSVPNVRQGTLTSIIILPQGVINAYMGVMVNQIRPLGYTDEQIGRIGLASTLVSCVVSISLGLITDRLKHKMKAIIITLLLVSTGSFIWLMLMCWPGSQANTAPKMSLFIPGKLGPKAQLSGSHCPPNKRTVGSLDPICLEPAKYKYINGRN